MAADALQVSRRGPQGHTADRTAHSARPSSSLPLAVPHSPGPTPCLPVTLPHSLASPRRPLPLLPHPLCGTCTTGAFPLTVRHPKPPCRCPLPFPPPPLQVVYDFVGSLDGVTALKYSLASTFPRRVYGGGELLLFWGVDALPGIACQRGLPIAAWRRRGTARAMLSRRHVSGLRLPATACLPAAPACR
jgi:hypothetical protein